MHKLNWDDLRFVLAVAEAGSVSAAAKNLGVNHATVLRRVTSFENECGGPVFERGKSGYRLRQDRVQVIEAARRAAQSVKTAENLMRGDAAQAASTIRITSTDTLCHTILPTIYPALARKILPDKLSILSSNAHLDLSRLRADVAIKPARDIPDDLVGRQIATMRFDAYAQFASPDKWLGLAGPLANALPATWVSKEINTDQILASADSFLVLRDMAVLGQGRVFLPCLLGDAHPDLQRVPSGAPDFEVPIWIAYHRDLFGSEKLRLVADSIEKFFVPFRDPLAGRA